MGYSPWGPKESDMTEQLSMQAHAPSEALGKNLSMSLPSLRWLLAVGQRPLAYGYITTSHVPELLKNSTEHSRENESGLAQKHPGIVTKIM